jgi:hypothetical protein
METTGARALATTGIAGIAGTTPGIAGTTTGIAGTTTGIAGTTTGTTTGTTGHGRTDSSVSRRGTKETEAGRALKPPTYYKPGTVNLSSFSYLFSELIQYSQSRVNNTGDLERRLEEVGRVFGGTLLELLHARNSIPPSAMPKEGIARIEACAGGYSGGSPLLYKAQPGVKYAPSGTVRYSRVLDILRFLYTTVWKYLFNKQATDLQQSNEHPDEYMISDDEAHLWVGKYVSVPKDMGNLNVYAWLGGVVQGVLEGAGFPCVRVTAHFVPVEGGGQRVTLLIKLEEGVVLRERVEQAKEGML